MKRILFLTIFTCFLAVSIFSQADLQTAAVVNLVRREPITVKQFRVEVDRMEKSAKRTLNDKERRDVLDVMINEKLALQAAEKEKVIVTENEVNQQIQQLRSALAQQIGRQPTEAEFATAVKNETGLEMAAFKDQARRQLIAQKYLMLKKQTAIESRIKVPTDEEITNAYNLTKAQFVRPDTVRLSMIQVAYGADEASKKQAKTLADSLAKKIGTSPSVFDEAVLESQAPNSGYQAGDASYMPRNREAAQVMGQEFIDIAFNLKQGEVSKLIEGRAGYQIIKITERYSMKNLELDDILQPGTRITVRDYIGNSMLQERQMEEIARATQELLTELRAGKTFQVFEENLTW